jgi:hypothetical protein
MFLSEAMMRAIHADRVREIERATREHRLVAAAGDEPTRTETGQEPWPRASSASRGRRSRVTA